MVVSWSKTKAWIKAHWNWLVLVGLFCLAYALGRKNARGLLVQAEIAKAQYKAEAEAIEQAANKKTKRDQNIDDRTREIKRRIELKKQHDLEDLKRDIDPDKVFEQLGIDKK
tara:strand:+ start:1531 stop:1866 length:336 start_codon:yes stop_codon:yes gene_type:complete